jgi:hypothetical protein
MVSENQKRAAKFAARKILFEKSSGPLPNPGADALREMDEALESFHASLEADRGLVRNLHAAAHEVRRRAQGLSDHPAGQDEVRFGLEAALRGLEPSLRDQIDTVSNLDLTAISPAGAPRFIQELIRGSGERSDDVERLSKEWLYQKQKEWLEKKQSGGSWLDAEIAVESAIGAASEELRTALESFGCERVEAVASARGALATASAALQASYVTLTGSPKLWPPGPEHVWAATPFLVYLLMMVVGFVVPTPPAAVIWGAAVALFLAVSLAVFRALRLRLWGGFAVSLGGGSSLAFFTALYLVCTQLRPLCITRPDPAQLLDPAQSLGPIAESALLSLTVFVTAGTLDVVLNGIARFIAWVQILFTLFLVASVATWGWNRLVGRPAPQGDSD